MTSSSLQPTWYGYVSSARDALILFEACLNGTLHHVARRPHDRERSSLIKSGYVFIYEENASGIKRWTDGVPWSPSRILGNFLVYRELEKPFPPGEKKRATKRNKRPARPGEPYPRPEAQSPTSPTTPTSRTSDRSPDDIRALIGSLVDSYGFKDEGLVKKTMSVNVHGVHHHLVSYYKVEDVTNGTLRKPTDDHRLVTIEPRADLVARQNFRAPIDETDNETGDGMNGVNPYGYPASYDTRAPLMQPAYPQGYAGVGMSMYPGGMTYSSAGYTPSMPSYAPMTNSQSYYSAQQAPQAHTQLDSKDNRQSLPQPNYYRPNPAMTTASLGPLSTVAHSNLKVEDGSNMSRPPGGHYAPTAAGSYMSPTSQSMQSPTYPSTNGYSYPASSQQNLPSLGGGYGAHSSGHGYMDMQNNMGPGSRPPYGGHQPPNGNNGQ